VSVHATYISIMQACMRSRDARIYAFMLVTSMCVCHFTVHLERRRRPLAKHCGWLPKQHKITLPHLYLLITNPFPPPQYQSFLAAVTSLSSHFSLDLSNLKKTNRTEIILYLVLPYQVNEPDKLFCGLSFAFPHKTPRKGCEETKVRGAASKSTIYGRRPIPCMHEKDALTLRTHSLPPAPDAMRRRHSAAARPWMDAEEIVSRLRVPENMPSFVLERAEPMSLSAVTEVHR
jgi:hypothetical protein